MCEKCVELDSKIEHYQHMASRITDQQILDGIKKLIELGASREGCAPSGARDRLSWRSLSCPLVAGNDAYWHFSDMPGRSADVRYSGESGCGWLATTSFRPQADV
jgi:hypothetical protein